MKGAARRLWRTSGGLRGGTLGVVCSMAAALAMVALVGQVGHAARATVEGWAASARLICELDPALPAAEQAAARAALAALPGVAEAALVSPAAALARFRARSDAARALVEGLGDDVLPPTVELFLVGGARGWSEGASLQGRAEGVSGVARVADGANAFVRLGEVARLLAWVTFALGLAGAGMVLAICANTVRLALARQREDIAIMRLVGASWSFVAAPYLAVATLWGLAAGALGAGALWGAERLVGAHLAGALAQVATGVAWRLTSPALAAGMMAAGGAACLLAALGVVWGSHELSGG